MGNARRRKFRALARSCESDSLPTHHAAMINTMSEIIKRPSNGYDSAISQCMSNQYVHKINRNRRDLRVSLKSVSRAFIIPRLEETLIVRSSSNSSCRDIDHRTLMYPKDDV